MGYSISLAYRFRRLLGLSLAAAGFGVLFLAARSLGFDLEVAGISDEDVRPFAHFCVYGSLAVLLAKALWRQHLLAWLIAVVLATGEEVHQLFVPFRYATLTDWAVNIAGITVFLLAAKLIVPRIALPVSWSINPRRRLAMTA